MSRLSVRTGRVPSGAAPAHNTSGPVRLARRSAPLAGALVVGLALSACGGSSAKAGSTRMALNISTCGTHWSAAPDGDASLTLTNRFYQPMDVYLADTKGAVYEEMEGIGSKATVSFSVVLGSGSYQLQCYPQDEASVLGPVVTVHSSAARASRTVGTLPITQPELIPPTQAYQKWVEGRLPGLERQVQSLAGDLRAGSVSRARSAWLTAHMTYETLGAAYDAFGDINDAINGFPEGSQTALQDKGLTGFHEIEALMWSGAPIARVLPYVTRLQRDVRTLEKQFATTEIDPNILALRAHEIVENAVQFELTGQSDAGSHSNLATIYANLYGSKKTLDLLVPLLRARYPALPQAEAAEVSTRRLVGSYDHHGRWEALQSLTRRQREQLDAQMENLVQLLAPVAAIGDIRYVPQAS